MITNNGHNGHDSNRIMTDHQPVRRTAAPREKKKRSFFWLWFILFLLVLAAVVAFVLLRRTQAQETLKTSTQQMAVPSVQVTKPERGDDQIHLILPGTVDPLIESAVYAQVSGYIKKWYVDIGGSVKAGQLLADIETPVTDQSLLQAGESVKQAEANLNLAQVTAARYNALFSTHAVAQQDVDNQNANVKVQQANVDAAKAFEGGIQKTEAFKQVRAPFDGVITARQIDVGDFVSATGQTATATTNGSGPSQTGTPNQQLFRVAQTKTLRVYVNVPENYADEIVPGIKATLVLASNPNNPATGSLVRTADAIDPTSLTLLSEVDVDNSDGKLFPGGYAQVHFDIVTAHPPLVIPGNSLIFRAQGPQVGVVDSSNTVHLQDIKIGRDMGTKLEIIDGVKPDDQVIVNPSDSLTDGQKVRIDTSNQGDQAKKP
jgi:multidrug efflux pump subunit AcrA (membrane-fusion protein)